MSIGRWFDFAILALLACGIYGRQPRKIIGPAKKVCTGQWKFQVSLWKEIPDSRDIAFKCGGAIIDEINILTAAHCVIYTNPSNILVEAGCHDLLDESKQVYANVTQIHIHPKFVYLPPEGVFVTDDIAILTMASPFFPSETISAINLPKADVEVGQIGEVAGWGNTEKNIESLSPLLLKTSMTILDRNSCIFPIPETSFCAIDLQRNTTISYGDSGSPLVINNTVVGIASQTHSTPLLPGYYINVFQYLGFINQVRSFSNIPVCHSRGSYLVTIRVKKFKLIPGQYVCAGVILDESHILTAAHCIEKTLPSEVTVKVGCVKLENGINMKRTVKKIDMNPHYHRFKKYKEKFTHDIAILTLDNPLLLNTEMSVNLPEFDIEIDQVGDILRIRGKNSTFLPDTRMIVSRSNSCQNPPITLGAQFCVNDASRGTTLDEIDAGSPFISYNRVVGIVSYFREAEEVYTICTNIYYYLDFIKGILRGSDQ